MNNFVLNQLPVLPPSSYVESDINYIAHRVIDLIYTAEDMREMASALAEDVQPISWDESRRAKSRAELDAYYAHLYDLTRDELRYILDPQDVFGPEFPSETFRVLKEGEQNEFGEYRTRRLVLEAFDKLAESPRFKDKMSKRISAFSELQQAAEVSS